MTEKFRLSTCRYCHNNKLDPNSGVQCGLDNIPEIIENECSEFDPNEADFIQSLERNYESTQFEEERRFNYYWYFGGIIITVIGLILAFYDRTELDENYRWTITQATVYKNEFSLKSPFLTKSYLYSTFTFKGKTYENKTEYIHEKYPGEADFEGYHFFIRFNPEDPTNSQIPKFKPIPKYVTLESVPISGIHKDSLKHFAREQLELYKNRNSNNTVQNN